MLYESVAVFQLANLIPAELYFFWTYVNQKVSYGVVKKYRLTIIKTQTDSVSTDSGSVWLVKKIEICVKFYQKKELKKSISKNWSQGFYLVVIKIILVTSLKFSH